MWRAANCANCTRRKFKKCSLSYEDGVGPVAPDSGKSRINLAAGAGSENLGLQTDSASNLFDGFQCGVGIYGIDRIDEHGNALRPGDQLTQQFQSLRR